MDAPHDQNFVKTKLGVSCLDGVTLIPIAIDPISGGVKVDTTSTISFDPATVAPRDSNHDPAWLGTSSSDDSVVLPIYVNANGAILIDL